ncbi:MAG: DUF6334 family protein [Oscillatoria sp. PMC 1051.18]|nr:DUF6334 family protein [Oscillatoria sp. PMC 1050.18]MEC5032790.1 DUF6334 family protein [Oscillatoria sp. PMC 1051.18]
MTNEERVDLDNFPIGYSLDNLIAFEDQEFAGEELCLDKVELIFRKENHLGEGDIVILNLIPDPDTDEVIVYFGQVLDLFKYLGSETEEAKISDNCSWYQPFLSKKLQAAWICENNQGYQDQIIFAFERLHPSLAFVAEGSVIKVFIYEQVKREKTFSNVTEQNNLI